MKIKKRWYQRVWVYILAAIILISIFSTIQFAVDNRRAYDRLKQYDVKSIQTEFGKMSYIDEGSGEAVLISHGIFGGYDQGYVSVKSILGKDFRKIAPSRFGYPGSDLPANASPKNQAKAFLNLIDQLKIQKVYIMTASAGGSPGFQFALQYPDRMKGLILLSSGVPSVKKTRDQIPGVMGPPAPLLNDFPMWLSTKYFGFVFHSMFNSDINQSMYETMLPVSPRKKGIVNDETVTNLDMLVHFDDYKVEQIKVPILCVQAKDDPMVKYSDTQKFLSRVKAKTALFKTGGHLISGHGNDVSDKIKAFINETK